MSNLGIAIYDPRRLDPETFLKGFVARGDFVDFLLDKLRQMPEIGEHFLIVGQRGMGKTSLLRRLAIGISEEPALQARFIPLSFREEQYNVRALDAFWRNCAESLAEWCEDQGRQEIADDIDRSLPSAEWHESNSAVQAFLALCKRLGGRPVLFVDNLDLILDALSPQQNWELRRALQAAGGPIVFGAATQMLRQSADRDAAFYEFFHPHMLHPLSESELRHCMSRLAQARGDLGKPVLDVLDREPERIRTLHNLTGGNPRVLTLVYQLLERTESDSVFRDLEVLLDQLTPYYKARVEDYQTDLQRAVIDAIALHWHPITSSRLSDITAVEVTTISSQLNRLKNDGLIEEVETSGARAGYQLVERFFNIWYLMRHGTRRTRQKIAWLTEFLSSFYAPAELMKMKAELIAGGSASLHPLYREALEAAGEERGSLARAAVPEPSVETSQLGRSSDLLREAEHIVRHWVERDQTNYDGWSLLGSILADHSGHPAEAEAAYRKAMTISGDRVIAEANLAWLLLASGRLSEIASLESALTKLDPVGRALLDAARALVQDNFGDATGHLQQALNGDQEQLNATFSDDLLRLLRIAAQRGYGEKLIEWFNQSGQADRRAPVYAAFVAFVRGERFLLDFSPEIRKPAESIFRWLNSRSDRSPSTPDKPARKRGRPPRKRQTA